MPSLRLLYFLLRLALVATTAGVAQALPDGRPIVTTFETNGLGRDTKVWCAAQDENGVMYLGGDRLYVADGDRWQAHDMGSTYAVRALEFGVNGRLWAAGYNELGWFERDQTGIWGYHSLRNQLPENATDLGDVWSVYATPQGAIFISATRVLQWDGAAFTITEHEAKRRIISTRYNGKIYISNHSGGLQYIGPNGLIAAKDHSALDTEAVFLIVDTNGETVYFTGNGVGKVTDNQLKYEDPKLSDYIQENILTTVKPLPNGSFALGTLNGGLVLVGPDLSLQDTLGAEDGIPSDVYGLHVALDESLWVTSSTQIYHWSSPKHISFFDQRQGLPPKGCLDLAFNNDEVFALTPEGVFRWNGIKSEGFEKVTSIHGIYRDIAAYNDGLLVSTMYGIYALHDTVTTSVYRTTHDALRIKPADMAGLFQISADQRIAAINVTTREIRYLTERLPDSAIDFASDQKGRLWISTASKSLLVATPSPEGPVDAESASLHYEFPTSEGYTQVAKLGDAIIGINPDKAYWLNPATDRFESIDGFPAGNALAVSDEDDSGRVWVALEGRRANMPMRLGHLVWRDNRVVWVPHSVAGLAKVGTPRALQVQPTPEGDVLWIAGSGGLLQIKRPGDFAAVVPRKPILTAVARSAPDAAPQAIEGRLPYSTRRIHLQFGSGEFALRDTLRYQTMLEGVDETWSAPANTAELELANLREGDYTFKVRLLSDTGLAGEPATLHFTIAPPWWRTPYAYGGYALSLGLALTGLYRLRVRTIRRRAAHLERTVRERTEQLEKANAAKTEFVASMSHEIRNPMNGIIGSAHALADTPLNEQQREIVTTLRNCATFLSSLVEDVLDFSSIEAGVFNVQHQPYNPAGVLEAVGTMLATHATEAGAHFDIEVDPALPARLLGDPARIQQIVINYATNALKFSGGGRVQLSTRAENGEVVFAVSDNGPGIRQEEQMVLFTRFSRLKAARNAGITGTGLGLAVCRALAERMNGTVGVASTPGQGATFYLRLPLVATSATATTSRTLPKFEGARALIVEDLPYNAQILRAMLGKYGFTIDLAVNGADALRRLADHAYNAVFLDYDLPDMNGLEVARRMRRIERDPRPLVVATTAYSTVQDRENCLKAGMDVFLSKPITPEKLREALDQLIVPARSPQAQPAEPQPKLDMEMLAYLAGNDPKRLWHEIQRFLDSLAGTHEEAITALRILNRTDLRRAAHRILSHACMVKHRELIAITQDLEIEAPYAAEERLDELVADATAAIEQLKKMMEHHRPAQTSA